MKKLIIALLIIIVTLTTAGFWLVSNAQKLANHFKPDLEKAIGTSLDSKVQLGTIKVQFFPDLQLAIDGINISKHEKQKGLHLKQLALSLQLLPLIKGSLVIDQIILTQPNIKLIKTKSSSYIEGLEQNKKIAQQNGLQVTSGVKRNDSTVNTNDKKSALRFALQELIVKDGLLTIDDRVSKKETALAGLDLTTKVNLTGNKLDLTNVKLKASLAKQLPLQLDIDQVLYDLERSQLDLPSSQLGFLGGQIASTAKLDLSTKTGKIIVKSQDFPLQQLPDFLKALHLPDDGMQLAGQLVTDSELQFKENTALSLSGKSQLQNVSLKKSNINVSDLVANINHTYSDNQLKANDQSTTFKFNGSKFDIDWRLNLDQHKLIADPINISALGGKVNLKFDLALGQNQNFTTAVKLNNVSISDAISAFTPGQPAKVTGTISQANINLSGAIHPSVTKSLNGSGSLEVSPAVIKDINVAGEALKSVSNLPFLNEALLRKVPEDLRSEFTQKDSHIDHAKLTWSIANSVITISNLDLSSKLYQITGTGTMTVDQDLNFKTSIYLSPSLSSAMISATRELKYLQDTQGRITFPISITGRLPNLTITPQLDRILKNAATDTVKDKIADELGKAIGGRGQSGKEAGKAIRNILGF